MLLNKNIIKHSVKYYITYYLTFPINITSSQVHDVKIPCNLNKKYLKNINFLNASDL